METAPATHGERWILAAKEPTRCPLSTAVIASSANDVRSPTELCAKIMIYAQTR
jgi:hypothetical protein